MAKKGNLQLQLEELRQENASLREENAALKEDNEKLRAESVVSREESASTVYPPLEEQVEELARERDGYREKLARYKEEKLTDKQRHDEERTKLTETVRIQMEFMARAASKEIELERRVDQLQEALRRAKNPTDLSPGPAEGDPVSLRDEEPSVEEPQREMPAEERARLDETSITVATTSTVPHLVDQVPPLAPFRGDLREDDEDSFTDWIEQFEELAGWHSWGDAAKLSQLRMRLQGPARAYCRSRPQKEQESYETLKKVLKERYTPVHVQSVQSALYYGRRQGATESVDGYAQDLRKLYRKAYPKIAAEGGEESERSLASKFLSGLRPQLQKKLAGAEGTLDQLVARARFEETTHKEIQAREDHGQSDRSKHGGRDRRSDSRKDEKSQKTHKDTGKECYNCGGTGHFARDCPHRGRAQPKENPGKSGSNNKSVPSTGSKTEGRFSSLRTLTASVNKLGSGPRWEKQVELNGQPVRALLDSGSPVTIVNLVCWMQIWKDNHSSTDPDWRSNLLKAVKESPCRVYHYGGEEIEIEGSAEVKLKVADRELTLPILLQDEAPQELLIGTDVLNQLEWTLNGKPLRLEGEGAMEAPVVRLTKAVRIPPRHAAAVQACGKLEEGTWLIEGQAEKPSCVSVETVLVESDGEEFPLLLTNPTTEVIKLDAGHEIPCMMEKGIHPARGGVECAQVNALNVDSVSPLGCKERSRELLKVLGVDVTRLDFLERDQLAQMVLNYQDVFAMAEDV